VTGRHLNTKIASINTQKEPAAPPCKVLFGWRNGNGNGNVMRSWR